MRSALQPGDRVKYAAKFLRSCGLYAGPAPFAKGTVVEVTDLRECQLVEVKWDKDGNELPFRIHGSNLTKVGRPELD